MSGNALTSDEAFEVAVIGGGFYGAAIAAYLAEMGRSVVLVEREQQLMTRASYVNQARLHNGYHYPRSFRTAIRSRANLDRFCEQFAPAVATTFRPLYAIASDNSKVSPSHFERFCHAAGIPLRQASKEVHGLFDRRTIARVYEAEEPAFNADALRGCILEKLQGLPVTMCLGENVERIAPPISPGGAFLLHTSGGHRLMANWVFNCTYAAINSIDLPGAGQRPRLRHQIAEVALIEPPAELAELGVTIMDGPFFSAMPFPARKLHSLTHVRYTPHLFWAEKGEGVEEDPMQRLRQYLGNDPKRRSRYEWMIRDARRYVPALDGARFVDTLLDIKTLLPETVRDDARPILYYRSPNQPRFISVLGGKIDNIFDIFEYIDRTMGSDEGLGDAAVSVA